MAETEPIVALLAGASGFAGARVLEALLEAPEIARVFAVTRRPLGREHPRLANRIVPFAQLERQLQGVKCRVAFCCLGARAAERTAAESLEEVDVGYTLAFARAARAAGAERLVLLSAAGADPEAKTEYLRAKGKLERSLEAVGFASLDILQPAVLLGWPVDARPVDLLRRAVMPALNPLLVGSRVTQRGIPLGVAAAAMLGAMRSGRRGVQRHGYKSIGALAQLKPRWPAKVTAAATP